MRLALSGEQQAAFPVQRRVEPADCLVRYPCLPRFQYRLDGVSLGDHFAVEEMDIALGVPRKTGIVRHHADGRAVACSF